MTELKYKTELDRAMTYIGALENSIFVGQAVRVPGTAMSGTLENVDKSVFTLLKDHIETNNATWKIPNTTVKCDTCETEAEIQLDLDQASFFAGA